MFEIHLPIFVGGSLVKSLKMCPKCDAKLKVSPDGETQYCPVCRYWTKIGTVRLDSIMIYGWGVSMGKAGFSVFCDLCKTSLKRQVLGS